MTAKRAAPTRELGGVGEPTDLMRPLSLDGVVVVAAPARASGAGEAVFALCARQGWAPVEATTASAAGWAAAARKTSLVVVTSADTDFVLGTVPLVRRSTSSPIAVLALMGAAVRKRVLADGADLVLPDNLDDEELRLHLVALLRRAAATWEPQVRYLVSGPLVIDLWSRTCLFERAPLHLPRTEYELLVFLMRHARKTITIEKIIQRVWQSRAYHGQLNAARIAVSRLRTKLEAKDGGRQFIRSVRGVGYEFCAPVLEVGDGANGAAVSELDNLRLSGVLLEVAAQLRDLPFRDAVQRCVDLVVAATGGHAGAVFVNTGDRIALAAERGNPAEFCRLLSDGLPLRGRSEVHSEDVLEPTQVDDIARLARGSQSVQIMARHGFHSYLYVPLVADGRVWGGLRLASRTKRPFDPVVTTFCTAVGAMLSLKLPRTQPQSSAEFRSVPAIA